MPLHTPCLKLRDSQLHPTLAYFKRLLVCSVMCAPLAVCSGSPTATNATFSCGTSSLPGVRCNATCDAGYQPGTNGAPSAVCGNNGAWDVATGTSCDQIGEFVSVRFAAWQRLSETPSVYVCMTVGSARLSGAWQHKVLVCSKYGAAALPCSPAWCHLNRVL